MYTINHIMLHSLADNYDHNKSTARCIIRPFKFLGHMLEPLRESMCNVSSKSIKNSHTELGDAGSIISQVIAFTGQHTELTSTTLEVGQGDPNTNSSETFPIKSPNTELGDA